MNRPDEIAALINALPRGQRSGTLQIWGDWFGRPLDNIHICTSCYVEQDHLVLFFTEDEQLHVWDPDEVASVGASLIIGTASRVRWEWYRYGEAHIQRNLLYLDYAFTADQIIVKCNGTWKTSHTAVVDADAVVLYGSA